MSLASTRAGRRADLHERDLVYTALRHDDVFTIVGRLDVANDAAAARNDPALEFLRFDIEAHEHVRLDSRLDVPDRAALIGNPVRLRLRPARRRPFGDLAGFGVEASQIAARVVRVPDDVVRADRDAPRTALGVRQRVLLDRERLGVDLDDLVRPEVAHVRYAFGREYHAVRASAVGR